MIAEGDQHERQPVQADQRPGWPALETAKRATFVIDKEGKIIEETVGDEAVDPTKIVDLCERRKLGK